MGSAGPGGREAAPARNEHRCGLSRLKSGTSPVSNSAGAPAAATAEVRSKEENIAPFNPRRSCVFHPSTTAPPVCLGTGAVDEAWKTRGAGAGVETRQHDMLLAGAGDPVPGLAGSVFHGLSTDAISGDSKAAVGRRWETRGRIVGKPCWERRSGVSCPMVNIAPFRYGRRAGGCGRRGGGRRKEHRPIQSGAGLRFPPFDHRASGLTGTGAVDEAWKTRRRWSRGRDAAQPECPRFGRATRWRAWQGAFSTGCPRARSPRL